jgi:hypothetical protein
MAPLLPEHPSHCAGPFIAALLPNCPFQPVSRPLRQLYSFQYLLTWLVRG